MAQVEDPKTSPSAALKPVAKKRARRTDYELAQLHQRQALKLQMRGQRSEIIWAMDERPEVVSELRRVCESIGRVYKT